MKEHESAQRLSQNQLAKFCLGLLKDCNMTFELADNKVVDKMF